MTLALKPKQHCGWDQISLGEVLKLGKTEVIVEGARNFVAFVKHARDEMAAARTGVPHPLG
jgi:hypothetical protein